MLQGIYEAFRWEVSSGMHCRGEDCSGWCLSPVDTVHACSCGKGTDRSHPECSHPDDDDDDRGSVAQPVAQPVSAADSDDDDGIWF